MLRALVLKTVHCLRDMAKIFIDPTGVVSNSKLFEYDLELESSVLSELDSILKFAGLPPLDASGRSQYKLQLVDRGGGSLAAPVDILFEHTFKGQGVQEGYTLKLVSM